METAMTLNDALCCGYERLVAWTGLLDRINVFPVADDDTGTNLKISLAPLRWPASDSKTQIQRLMMAATGNSGNIAAAFFCELVKAETIADLKQLIGQGQLKARQSISDPQPGTMLSVLEVFAQCAGNGYWREAIPDYEAIILQLEKSVAETADILPVLQQAGVIDAGALAMFIFIETYLCALFAPSRPLKPVTEIFPDKLAISTGWKPLDMGGEYCINTLIQTAMTTREVQQALLELGDSMVVTGNDDQIKVHMHTQEVKDVRDRLTAIGQVTDWAEEAMSAQLNRHRNRRPIHIMTDAAGSFSLEDARELGVTLLNSYLIVGDQACPETHFSPRKLYDAMAAGVKVSTAQASLFERQQTYLSVARQYQHVLYLCVGSVYTGNFEVASTWKSRQGIDEDFHVLDTGAASGRLGIIALATARFARTCDRPDLVRRYAESAMAQSREFVFLDQLKYLAAGGRISKSKGFFGDLLHMKPIISPRPEGAVKVGVVRRQQDQLPYALNQLDQHIDKSARALILVQYSDNRTWVEQTAAAMVDRFPAAEIVVRPLSLTSGAHMGPGTWAVAFLPPLPAQAPPIQSDSHMPER